MIHSTAIIDPTAEIAEDVQIGPFCVIEGPVKIGSGTILDSHVVIEGHVSIGENNRFYSFVSIAAPQDKKYVDEDTTVEIGNGNTFRENVTKSPQ